MERFIHRGSRTCETKHVGAGTIFEHGALFPEILMPILIDLIHQRDYSSMIDN